MGSRKTKVIAVSIALAKKLHWVMAKTSAHCCKKFSGVLAMGTKKAEKSGTVHQQTPDEILTADTIGSWS